MFVQLRFRVKAQLRALFRQFQDMRGGESLDSILYRPSPPVGVERLPNSKTRVYRRSGATPCYAVLRLCDSSELSACDVTVPRQNKIFHMLLHFARILIFHELHHLLKRLFSTELSGRVECFALVVFKM